MAAADIATVRILIVDNHELVRISLALELNQYADLEVVGVAADGEKAVALTEQLQPPNAGNGRSNRLQTH